jgi:polysaccharide biosynthesis transport protein
MILLRKYALWLIVAALAGVAGALLFYAARPASYVSTAQVDVEPNTSAPGTPVVPNMATEEQVATSGVVLGSTANALGKTPSEMTGHLSAKVSGTASVLSISCKMPTAAEAQHCANVAAASYVAYRDQVTSSATSQAHSPLNVTLVTPASLPTALAGPGKKILLPLGAFLGLMLGIGAIFVRDHFDDRVRDRADLARCLDGPVLGEIPRTQAGVDPASVFSQAPLSKAADAYRYIRSHLQTLATSAEDGAMVLLVAGPYGGEGSTCVAANVATALAQAGSSVILVDGDLRHRSLTKVLGGAERPGLSELLTGSASRDEVVIPASTRGLRLVTAGEVPDQAADIFEFAWLARAFAGMKAIADVIVVDGPPLLTVSDAIILAGVSDLVMVVADVRRTDRAAVSAAAQEIRATGSRTIVGVLNRVPSPKNVEERHTASPTPVSATPPPSLPATLVGTDEAASKAVDEDLTVTLPVVPTASWANGKGRDGSLTGHRTDTEE